MSLGFDSMLSLITLSWLQDANSKKRLIAGQSSVFLRKFLRACRSVAKEEYFKQKTRYRISPETIPLKLQRNRSILVVGIKDWPRTYPRVFQFLIIYILACFMYSIYTCSGQKTPDWSWGRRSEALGYLGSGNLEGEGLGEGWVRGGQFTSNLRPRWTDPVTARRVPSK